MELDSFLISPRWEILQMISLQPSSPTEIAKKLGTTISYISQQLKLLEAAGIVKKERTGSVDKGKPRTIFTLSNEMIYITALSKELNLKKTINLTEYHKLILRIWFVDNNLLHEPLHKLFLRLEKNFSKIDFILLDVSRYPAKLYFSVNDKSFKIKDFVDEKLFDYEVISENKISSLENSSIFVLFDPENKFNKQKILKGGKLI